MKTSELASAMKLDVLQNATTDHNIVTGYTSDLLSDVMAHAQPDSALITIQAHKNTIAVATLANVKAVIVCNNRPAPSDMLEAAATEDIAVFRTDNDQYTTSWLLHEMLKA
jgi:hypothetical protein